MQKQSIKSTPKQELETLKKAFTLGKGKNLGKVIHASDIELDQVDPKTQKSYSHLVQIDDDHAYRNQFSRSPFSNDNAFTRFYRSDFFRKHWIFEQRVDQLGMSRSHLELNDIEGQLSDIFLIHPESKFKQIWDALDFVFNVLQFFLLPLFVGYNELRGGLPILSGICASVFFISMMFTSRTGIFKEYTLIMDRNIIFDEYFQSGRMAIDFILLFPYVFVIDGCVSDLYFNTALRLICLINALRIIKIFFVTPPPWYKAVVKKIHMSFKINGNMIGIVKVLGFIIVYW